ncbi:MAG TPA: hypothetical protein DCX09_08545 [Gammaproteobacteria bacterium]|nr:MAG: hypothetical protein CBD23_007345 [Gammaproteobacteria bacterium TMED163]HAU24709.1 hypothetical protein [Gammaproteobacteria bacterium]|tara:strand:- start:450 stop:668 length:219 start_codon:yes stop_codon:yes gene_type:complete
MNGQGTFFYANGNRFEGAFRQNQIHGQGTYYFYNGDRYVGPWLRGERDGPGIYYDAKGNSKQMEFRGGRRVT